jgi:hypothetical protein
MKNLKLILVVLLALTFSCSSDDEVRDSLMPVQLGTLEGGVYNLVDVKDYQGNSIYTDCDLSGAKLRLIDDGDTEWMRFSNNCNYGTYNYYDWGMYENDGHGRVRLKTINNQNIDVHVLCRVDILNDRYLVMSMLSLRNTNSLEVTWLIEQEDREYYHYEYKP